MDDGKHDDVVDADILADVAAYLATYEPLPPLSSSTESELQRADADAAPLAPEKPQERAKTRNVTRERRQRELRELRAQCAELEQQLVALQSTKTSHAPVTQQQVLLTAWKRIAQYQRAHRARVELENAQLKQSLAQHEAIAASIATSMREWLALTAPAPSPLVRVPTATPTRIAMQPFANVDSADLAVYEQLLAELDSEHARMDAVLLASGLIHWQTTARASTAHVKVRTGASTAPAELYLELLEVDVLPFAPATVANASWQCWQQRKLPPQSAVYAHVAVADSATIVSKLRYEVVVSGASVELDLLCALRLYVSPGRVATVLRGITKADAHFPGVVIDETDWQLMVPVGDAGAATAFYSCAHLTPKHVGAPERLEVHASPLTQLTQSTYEVDMDELCNMMMGLMLRSERLQATIGTTPDTDHKTASCSGHSSSLPAAYVRHL